MTATILKKKNEIKAEAQLTMSQRITNLHSRLLSGSSYEEEYLSDKMKKQIWQSCGCGKNLRINEHNQIEKAFTCKKRFFKRLF